MGHAQTTMADIDVHAQQGGRETTVKLMLMNAKTRPSAQTMARVQTQTVATTVIVILAGLVQTAKRM